MPPRGSRHVIARKAAVRSEAAAEVVDPWLAPLHRVRGKAGFDGLERVSSQTLLDMLEVPQRGRTAGTYRRIAKLMVELGWTAVRVRDLTRGGYIEQIRGYCRASQTQHRTDLQLKIDNTSKKSDAGIRSFSPNSRATRTGY